jgi:hypothetical protein
MSETDLKMAVIFGNVMPNSVPSYTKEEAIKVGLKNLMIDAMQHKKDENEIIGDLKYADKVNLRVGGTNYIL